MIQSGGFFLTIKNNLYFEALNLDFKEDLRKCLYIRINYVIIPTQTYYGRMSMAEGEWK